jgi:hypothetical protein
MFFKTGFYAVSMLSELAIIEVVNVLGGQDLDIGYEKEKSKMRKFINQDGFSISDLESILNNKSLTVYLGKP